jgi:hypothetical protein
MAQADYIIANQAGNLFRADLNDTLSAIVSNNSSATEPATMYAYQWWADTNSGLLKQRNAANNGWVTIGTMAQTNLGLLSLSGGAMTGAITTNSTFDGRDISVDGTKLDTLTPTAAVVSGHVKSGYMQLVDGSESLTGFSVTNGVAEGTFETFGPTGSGATNILADMDDIPAGSGVALFLIEGYVTATNSGNGSVIVRAAKAGITPSVTFSDNQIFGIRAIGSSSSAGASFVVFIPLNSSRVFQLTYEEQNQASVQVTMLYKGFVSN